MTLWRAVFSKAVEAEPRLKGDKENKFWGNEATNIDILSRRMVNEGNRRAAEVSREKTGWGKTFSSWGRLI